MLCYPDLVQAGTRLSESVQRPARFEEKQSKKIPGRPKSQNGTGETRESKRNGNPPELLDMRVVYVRVVLLRVRLLGFFERETGSVFWGPPNRCCVPVWCPFKTHQTKGGLPQQKTHTR